MACFLLGIVSIVFAVLAATQEMALLAFVPLVLFLPTLGLGCWALRGMHGRVSMGSGLARTGIAACICSAAPVLLLAST